MPPMLVTACMVGFVEATCIDALKPYFEDRGHPCRSQPCRGDARGMRVTAQMEVVAVEGRKLRFKVECRDEKEIFGTDFH